MNRILLVLAAGVCTVAPIFADDDSDAQQAAKEINSENSDTNHSRVQEGSKPEFQRRVLTCKACGRRFPDNEYNSGDTILNL